MFSSQTECLNFLTWVVARVCFPQPRTVNFRDLMLSLIIIYTVVFLRCLLGWIFTDRSFRGTSPWSGRRLFRAILTETSFCLSSFFFLKFCSYEQISCESFSPLIPCPFDLFRFEQALLKAFSNIYYLSSLNLFFSFSFWC